MPDTLKEIELPPPALVKPSASTNAPPTNYYTEEQVRCILADRSRLQVDQDARDAKRYQQILRTTVEDFDRMVRLAKMHSRYGGKSISESLDEAISRAAMDAVKEPVGQAQGDGK